MGGRLSRKAIVAWQQISTSEGIKWETVPFQMFIASDDWHFSKGNGVGTPALRGVDDKYGC